MSDQAVSSTSLKFGPGWGLGEDAYRAIVSDIRAINGSAILEFGSGVSTLRFTHDFPLGSIFSIESDPDWFNETKKLATHKGPARLTITLRPLEFQCYANGVYQTYRRAPLPERIDAVLIDGPPLATRRGREACLYQAMSSLRVGGRVYLDDYGRPFERQIVSNWLRVYPNSLQRREVFDVGHQVCVLEKVAVSRRPRTRPTVILDNLTANLKRALSAIRGNRAGAA